jgi:hypothetical protein
MAPVPININHELQVNYAALQDSISNSFSMIVPRVDRLPTSRRRQTEAELDEAYRRNLAESAEGYLRGLAAGADRSARLMSRTTHAP